MNNKSFFVVSILNKMSGVNSNDVNLIGADGHHILSFCVRFNDRNHIVNRVYVEDRTGLLRVCLSLRVDRSYSFEVYAAELPAEALETIDLVFSQDVLNRIAAGTLVAPVAPADPDDDDDEEDE